MTSFNREISLFVLSILFSCLSVSNCEEIHKSCCPVGQVLSLALDKSISCVNASNISSCVTDFHIGPRKKLSWEICDYELDPIIKISVEKDLFCVSELTFPNQKTVMPYLLGVRCKRSDLNKRMYGVNKCCKMGEMFSEHCVPIANNVISEIDREIDHGMVYAAVNIFSSLVDFVGNWTVHFRIEEKDVSYFTSRQYISDFSRSHPAEYCIEQSAKPNKIIVVTQTKCTNCVPQCIGFDKYLRATPDSEEEFEIRPTTWNQNDSYYEIYKFTDLFLMKTIVSWFFLESECSKGIEKYETYSHKIDNYTVTYQPYSHSYDLDICSGVIIGGNKSRNRELFSCRYSYSNWTLFKQILLILGFLSTILTFFVYGYLPSLRNFFGKSLMVYLLCCMGLNVLYIAGLFGIRTIQSYFYTGMIKYFFDISKTFWMFLMSHDVWTTMRKMNVRTRVEFSGTETRKFIWYSIFSFTISIILTSYLILDEHIKFNKIIIDKILFMDSWKKQYRYMKNDNQRNNDKFLIFYVIPTLIFVIINMIFYAHTLMHIYRIKQEIKSFIHLPASRSCFKYHNKFQYQFGLTVRLFCAMGLVWIFNVPALIISYSKLDLVSANTDFLHVLSEISLFLEGILIFSIFVMKRSIYEKLRKHFRNQLLTLSLSRLLRRKF